MGRDVTGLRSSFERKTNDDNNVGRPPMGVDHVSAVFVAPKIAVDKDSNTFSEMDPDYNSDSTTNTENGINKAEDHHPQDDGDDDSQVQNKQEEEIHNDHHSNGVLKSQKDHDDDDQKKLTTTTTTTTTTTNSSTNLSEPIAPASGFAVFGVRRRNAAAAAADHQTKISVAKDHNGAVEKLSDSGVTANTDDHKTNDSNEPSRTTEVTDNDQTIKPASGFAAFGVMPTRRSSAAPAPVPAPAPAPDHHQLHTTTVANDHYDIQKDSSDHDQRANDPVVVEQHNDSGMMTNTDDDHKRNDSHESPKNTKINNDHQPNEPASGFAAFGILPVGRNAPPVAADHHWLHNAAENDREIQNNSGSSNHDHHAANKGAVDQQHIDSGMIHSGKANDPHKSPRTPRTRTDIDHQPFSPPYMKTAEPQNDHDDTKYIDEGDNLSQTSSGAATTTRSIRPKQTTVAVGPKFICGERLKKRKEYYTMLEEKHKALEREKREQAARMKEEEEAALKQLRKSLVVKANPVPSFYREGPPPKTELKKLPVTRAKSPNLTRRKSCNDASNKATKASFTEEKGGCENDKRHSFGSCKDAKTTPTTATKTKYVTGSASSKHNNTQSRHDHHHQKQNVVRNKQGPSSKSQVVKQTSKSGEISNNNSDTEEEVTKVVDHVADISVVEKEDAENHPPAAGSSDEMETEVAMVNEERQSN
ncbi:OLC1v1005908C1 [Oldenlandia corymbosa var. corymbosa]|uniref:OLC1v1005908C1 n=1 Tax=Oldenlandia corymbosa var. corymbosa TaxID=529605 RepID=A0AAV1DFT2_OLDCO|nr:OLC1v1005908C1 [Oldenlandia corymbosa var. corymbosa]